MIDEPVGLCSYCLQPIFAQQPGGLHVKHEDGTPYRECVPALVAEAKSQGLPFVLAPVKKQSAA